MKTFYLLYLTYFFLNSCYGQKEDYVWYFGPNGAGLDFNNGDFCEPTLLTSAASNHFWEGAASICDKNTGQLLFYTDGTCAYNANNLKMLNCTGFWNTSTQNIIIQKPGATNLFYIIYPEAQAACSMRDLNHLGMTYVVVDMNLDSGLGGFTTGLTDLLDTPNCEKITAVKNSNGQDIWLIGHKYNTNKFFVFNVTSSGIGVPTYYNVGPIIYTYQGGLAGFNCFDAIGELKASPNGKKLAFTTFYNGTTSLFDFDNSTGVISNPINLYMGWPGYGVSFSPDNTKLYIGGGDTATITTNTANGHLFQFDISSNDSIQINNSRTLIYNSSSSSYGSLKLAPNGKIYATLHTGNTAFGSTYLEVINYPNNSGSGCGYLHNGFSLNALNSSWGLNNVMENNNYCINAGLNDLTKYENSLKIIPNLTNGLINIFLPKNINQGELRIFNVIGEKVYSEQFMGSQKTINIELQKGIYFVQVTNGNETWKNKIVKE